MLALLVVLGMGTTPAQATAPLFLSPAMDLAGKAFTPERLEGRYTCVIVANRENADAAAKVGQELVYNFSSNRNFAFVTVADLRGVPDFAHGLATTMIEEQLTAARAQLKERFRQNGRVYEPGLWVYIPDWEGTVTLDLLKASPLAEYWIFDRELTQLARFERGAIERNQKTLRSRVQFFILDRKGKIKHHFQDVGAASTVIATLRVLAQALK